MAKKRNLNRLLSLFLTLAMLFSLTVGLGGAAWAAEEDAPELSIEDVFVQGASETPDEASDAEEQEIPATPKLPDTAPDDESAAPPTIGAGYRIRTPDKYQIDPGDIRGTIYVDVASTPDNPVILIGNGTAPTATPNGTLTIQCTVAGVTLQLQDLWISSPYNGGSVFVFAGAGNTLSVTDGSTAIIESTASDNYAAIRVGSNTSSTTELTITGTATSKLYVYKDSTSAAVGGNPYEASGKITFASGNTFIKGSGVGAVVGGDSTSLTNKDITVSGGLLCIEANARGAGIGSSNQGSCAGNVYITGGTTLINVDFSGSAIGYGASGYIGGELHISGGTLEVYIDENATPYWNVGGIAGANNIAITADMYFGSGYALESDVAAVDLSGFDDPQTEHITATFTPDGGDETTAYDADGFNQYYYTEPATPPRYTPYNWDINSGLKTLYLYLPTAPKTGTIKVAVGDGPNPDTNEFAYVYDPATGFTVTPMTKYDFTFTSTATVDVYYTDSAQTIGSAFSVYEDGRVYFTVVPASGTVSASATNATLTPHGNGIFELSDPTGDGTVAITVTGTNGVYPVTFSGTHEYVAVGGVTAQIVTVEDSETLSFTVTPDYGWGIGAVTSSSGTVTPKSDGSYTLAGVTSAATVTIPTTQTFRTVTFSSADAVATIGGTIVQTATVPDNGVLFFKAAPYLGYDVTGVTPGSGTVTGPDADGFYMLSGATANTTVTIATAVDDDSWYGEDTSGNAYADTSWHTGASPYTLSDAADMAGLAMLVNGGTAFDGEVIQLSADVDLGTHTWIPIGGGRAFDTVGGVPSAGAAFKGTFIGGGHAITGVQIQPQVFADGLGAVGLFGYVDGGLLADFSVGGAVTFTESVYAVAGAVGFITGEIYHVTNNVTVAVNGANATYTGGVAGIVSNPGRSAAFYVENSVNNAAITGRSRLGGLVGETRAVYTGGVIVDQSYNTGVITGNDSEGSAYVGGVVGYSMGYILNCYNTANVTVGIEGGRSRIYAAGIAGLLNGASAPYAKLSDSYNTGLISTPQDPDFDFTQPLWAYNDDSGQVVVSNVVYLDNMPEQDNMGAQVTDIHRVDSGDMASSAVIGDGYLSGAYFAAGSPSPTLIWQGTAATAYGPIYFDPSSPTSGDGTITDPVNTLADAVALQSLTRTTIYALGNVTIGRASAETITVNPTADVQRVVSRGAPDPLIIVGENGTLNVPQGYVDGDGVGTGSLIGVANGGTLNVSGGSLQNNGSSSSTASGGGVNVSRGGTFNFTGGVISGNTGVNGGGVYLTPGSTFTNSGGTVSNNTAMGNGGGIYVPSGVTLSLATGSVSGNTARGNGGGVYLEGGALTMSGGVIGDNTAALGGGVYLGSGSSFELTGGEVTRNTSASDGGGVYLASGNLFTLNGGAISGNTANGNGGGVYVPIAQSFAVASGSVTGNRTTLGGGVYAAGSVTFASGSAANNTSNSNGGFVYVAAGGVFELTGGTISGNTASASGGGVYTSGTVTLSGGELSDNTATGGSGGGVYLADGTLTLSGTAAISANAAAGSGTNGRGGGIYKAAATSTLTLSGGSIDHNTATVGGGVHIITGNVTLSGTDITDNHANSGGGIYLDGAGASNPLTITGGSISNNTASTAGGLYLSWGLVNMSGGTISGNSPGGVYTSSSSTQFNMSGGSITNNTVPSGSGGGINLRDGTLNISGTAVISGNTANGNGGGISVTDRFTMTGGTISGNTASGSGNGGGVYLSGSSVTYTISGGVISGNSANNGGGIHTNNGTLNITDGAVIENNTATANGGGICAYSSNVLTISSVVMTGNTAALGKGVYVAYNNRVTIAPAAGEVFDLEDELYLPSGVTLWIGASLANITGDLNVRTAASPSAGLTVATPATGYTLTPADAQKIYYANTDDYSVTFSNTTAVLAASVFMDGSAAVDGNGTRANPFNNVLSALSESKYLLPVIMIGGPTAIDAADLDLSGGTYEGAVFRRGLSYTGVLFSVAAGDSAQVSGVFIEGTKQYVPASTGSIFQVSGTLTLDSGAVLENNRATNGGGVNVAGGALVMQGGGITGNIADSGGGIHVGSGSAELDGGAVSNNTATGNGGGVAVYAQFTLSGATISGNTAVGNGGGVYLNYANILELSSGTISGNSAQNGGGIYADYNIPELGSISITGNTASANGGGIYIPSGVVVTVTGSVVINGNSALLGQCAYATGTTTAYPLVINPESGQKINISDIVYLDGANTRIDLLLTLTDSNIDTPLKIQVSNPTLTRNVARTPSNAVATASVSYFERWTGDPMAVGTGLYAAYIIYNGDTIAE
ncbi:MAG: hypothetical protein LBK23_03150 [Oscillospiraceae bacterium]|jgi:hypothetical protein|nr:hypothetical protein [Oscillospiraceae bacterium]